MLQTKKLNRMGCYIRDLGGEFEDIGYDIEVSVKKAYVDPDDSDSWYSENLAELTGIGRCKSKVNLLRAYLDEFEKVLNEEETYLTNEFIRLSKAER